MTVIFVYATAESQEQAKTIARKLVETKLAACVNILPKIESVYAWQGQVKEAQEAAMIIKTRQELYPALEKQFLALHSYDCPAMVILPVSGGLPGYLEWIETA